MEDEGTTMSVTTYQLTTPRQFVSSAVSLCNPQNPRVNDAFHTLYSPTETYTRAQQIYEMLPQRNIFMILIGCVLNA